MRRVHIYPGGIISKVNIITRLEYELVNSEDVVQLFSYFNEEIPPE